MEKFISENELDQIEFHDCIIETIQLVEDILIFIIESVYVLADHSLNSYGIPKTTDKCKLEFIKPYSISALTYGEGNQKEQISIQEIIDWEILKFDYKTINNSEIEYNIFGQTSRINGSHFSEIFLRAESTKLYWNKYIDNAWFYIEDN